jgi:hypothetical protein
VSVGYAMMVDAAGRADAKDTIEFGLRILWVAFRGRYESEIRSGSDDDESRTSDDRRRPEGRTWSMPKVLSTSR